jgi:hypothetical protein
VFGRHFVERRDESNKMTREPDQPSVPPPAGQSAVERVIERAIVLFAKAMVAMAFVVTVYGVLVGFFFLCCGMEVLSFANPARSPLGPVVTILVVWPLGGFLCLFLQGGLGDILNAVGKGVQAAIRAIRAHDDA